MRVWLDDVRPMPEHFDVHVKTAQEAIDLLKTGKVTRMSLDHDLGNDFMTGYDVAKFVEQAAFEGTLAPLRFSLHTDNPVGRKNMAAALRNAYKYWEAKK